MRLKLAIDDYAAIAFLRGYKRKKLSIIPVAIDKRPFVLATFNNLAGVETAGAVSIDVVPTAANFIVRQDFGIGDRHTST